MAGVKTSELSTLWEQAASAGWEECSLESGYHGSYSEVQLAGKPAKHASLHTEALSANPFQLGTKTRPAVEGFCMSITFPSTPACLAQVLVCSSVAYAHFPSLFLLIQDKC